MLFGETIRTAWRALTGNVLRTALTMLGMVIGVAAVVTMLAIGEGARASVESHIRSMGTNLLTVRPGAPRRGPVRAGAVETLTLEDAEALSRLDGIAALAPVAEGSSQLKQLANNVSAKVQGTTPEYFSIHSQELGSGALFSFIDVEARRRVAVIGSNVEDELFGELSAVGERIQIEGQSFRVVGVLKEKGEGFSSPDDAVVVPISTHMGPLFGGEALDTISIHVLDEERMDEVQAAVERTLRLRHRLGDGVDDDFHVRSQTEMLERMSDVTGTFTSLLGGVAAVSLIVGGIGIMNIMLVSVRERTREIGVRMAVGARRRDILLQFLVESIIVAVLGGAVGLSLGWGGAQLVSRFGGWEAVVPSYAVALSLGTSVAIGVVFGVGPASRAARLDPVEALRND